MTMSHAFLTWRTAYNFALSAISSDEYRSWGHARVWQDNDGLWIADIA